MRLLTRKGGVRLAGLAGLLALLTFWGWSCMISMPGKSFSGALPPLTSAERALSAALRRDVEELAGRIGNRNVFAGDALSKAADYVEGRLRETGLTVSRQTYEVAGQPCHNLETEILGAAKPGEIVVVGAHYDSVVDCPGANDNGTGVAALLALARALGPERPARTLRFVAFVNEEPPFFQTKLMGSAVYAQRCRERKEKVVAMLALETIGFYSDRDESQNYPPPLGLIYPSRGNFIGFVGNISSRRLVREAIGVFRERAQFPSEGAALPGWIAGVSWSDHWAFGEAGFPAIMVTDTAPFRYPHYHTAADTPDKVDFDRCARVVAGLEHVVRALAGVGAER